MSRLVNFREDVAEVVSDLIDAPCISVATGNPEPHTALVRWGNNGDWLTRDPDEGTFCAVVVEASVIVTANSIDYGGAQVYLEDKALTLLNGLGGQTLTNGGRCPKVVAIGEPGELSEDANLLAISVELAPTLLDLST